MKRPIFVLCLVAIVLIFCGQKAHAHPSGSPTSVSVGNRKVVFLVPPGWQEHKNGEGDGITLSLISKGSSILLFAKPSGSQPEAQPLRQFADRFAGTWKRPLYRWNSLVGAEAWDAFHPEKSRSRYIASGYTPRYEFLVSAHLSSEWKAATIRKTVMSLLASARETAPKPAPLLFGLKPNTTVKAVTPQVDPHSIEVNGKRLHLPQGFTTSDMSLPGIAGLSVANSIHTLNLVSTNRYVEDRLVLAIRWQSVAEGAEPGPFLQRWKKLVKTWPEKGYVETNLGSRKGEAVIYKRQVKKQLASQQRRGDWIFINNGLVMYGYAAIMGDRQLPKLDAAFEEVRLSLEGVR